MLTFTAMGESAALLFSTVYECNMLIQPYDYTEVQTYPLDPSFPQYIACMHIKPQVTVPDYRGAGSKQT